MEEVTGLQISAVHSTRFTMFRLLMRIRGPSLATSGQFSERKDLGRVQRLPLELPPGRGRGRRQHRGRSCRADIEVIPSGKGI